ncbi:MAG: peptide chain release factor N(5)-glutamine methyltransferase [Erysipelotrichaceae bacterium]|nr:peptide chain release factor N(5)-glutamine methyltransferase [Erysipelotrichaceae bacterium]
MTDEEKQVAYLRKYLEKDKLEEGIALLKKGIPVQYIVGNVDFYGNIIRVDKNVLIPRFETELLVDKTIKRINKYFNNKLIRILELGTGSGCIAISLKKEINSIIDAIDISKEALSVAIDNAKINNVDINFMLADMTTYKDKKYDVIISNPPYIKEDELIMDMVKDNEPNIALYADDNGLYYYKKIIDNINYLTNDKYLICFEIGYTQGKYIEEYAKDNLSDITVSIEKDYNDRDRFIFITNIK